MDEKHNINIHKSWELNHWCEELNLRAEELKSIVKRIGPNVSKIKAYLARRKQVRRL